MEKTEVKRIAERKLYRLATVELGHRPGRFEFSRYKKIKLKRSPKRVSRARRLENVWKDVEGIEDIGWLTLLSVLNRARFSKRMNKTKIVIRW